MTLSEIFPAPLQSPGAQRVRIIRDLLGGPVDRLLDIKSGRVAPDYPYLDLGGRITCVDWNSSVIPPLPETIQVRSGDFLDMDIPAENHDAVICADVFEHVLMELEAAFAAARIGKLRPGGLLIVSVPHAGRHAWLDPSRVRPALQRILSGMGLYRRTHNGFCDIRKSYKDCLAAEIEAAFAPLVSLARRYWGCLCDPLLSWSDAIGRKLGVALLQNRLARSCAAEFNHDYGSASFNFAVPA